MKKRNIFFLLLLGVMPVMAQTDLDRQKAVWRQMVQDTLRDSQTLQAPTLSRPWRSSDNLQTEPIVTDPASRLHATVDLSAFYLSGHNLPHHGGFSQNVNLSYDSPLVKDGRLWFTGGANFNNVMWGSDNYRSVNLYGRLDYQINDKLDVYLYGNLNLTNNRGSYYTPYLYGPGYGWYGGPWTSPLAFGGYPGYYGPGYYDGFGPSYYGALGYYDGFGYNGIAPGANVIGVGATYHPSRNFWISVNVERAWYNDPVFR
ncbi:MAG: hypothetical protein PUF37_05700 [Prevotellaceae bacterium]|nr:hypothetical protein [Prevotellaceae bacterium]